MYFHLQLLPILGLHLRSIHTSPIPSFKGVLETQEIGHFTSAPEVLKPGQTCLHGGCSSTFSSKITPMDQNARILNPGTKPKEQTGRILNPGSGTKEERPPIVEEKPRSAELEGIKTTSPVKSSRFATFTKSVKSIMPRIRKSIQGSTLVRQQWFKYTLQTENNIIRQLQRTAGSGYDFVPELIDKVTEIQILRTGLNKVYGVAHLSDEAQAEAVTSLTKKTLELNTYLNGQLADPAMKEKLLNDVAMKQIVAQIKSAEDLKLEEWPSLGKDLTFSDLQKAWIFPPGRDGPLALVKSMFRSDEIIQKEWAAYHFRFGVVTREKLSQLAQDTPIVELRNLARDARQAMSNEVEAVQALEVANHEPYYKSSAETLAVMRRISNYLISKDTPLAVKLNPTLEQYFKYQGVTRGPITFGLLEDTNPRASRQVAEILKNLHPPKGWQKDLRSPTLPPSFVV